jgi:hypothetical protein
MADPEDGRGDRSAGPLLSLLDQSGRRVDRAVAMWDILRMSVRRLMNVPMHSWRLGIVAVLGLTGCAAVAATSSRPSETGRGLIDSPLGVATDSPLGAGAGGWGEDVLVSASHHVSGTQLAVSESGAAVIGWLQGRGRAFCPESCPSGTRPFHGLRVMVARGTVAGGFGKPRELTAHGAGGLYVAQLSSGLTHVAWTVVGHQAWMIAAISHGHVSKPTVLPKDAQLQGLYTGRSRQAAAIWATPGNPRWSIHYAFLGPRGQLRRQGNIARLTRDFTYPRAALNDRGELAALWTQGTYKPVLGLCTARGRCAAPRRLPIPGLSMALALADDGAVVVLGGNKGGVGGLGPGPHPLQAVIAHVGRRKERVVTMPAAGFGAVATSDGRAGAVALVDPRRDSPAWTFLRAGSDTFTRPQPTSDRMVDGDFTVLAANLKGGFVAAWNHFTAFANGSNEISASLGSGTKPREPVTIVGASQEPDPATIRTGIDGHSNAIVTWSQFSGQGTKGLFENIHLRR